MIRVLHVATADPDQQTRIAIDQLLAASPTQFESNRFLVRDEPVLAVRDALTLRYRSADVDIVHAWGTTALKVAAAAINRPVVFTPTSQPDRATVGWVRAIGQYRSLHVMVPTETARRRMVETGVAMDRCHCVPTGVDFSRIDKPRGRALRERLGFNADDRVLLAVGESSRETDHARAAWAAVILHVLDARNRLLLWGRGPLADSTARFARKLGQPRLLAVATERLSETVDFEQILGAADVALITNASAAPTLPVAMCMAAALPIVSVTDSTLCELLEDRHNALLTTSRNPRVIARRVMDLMTDERRSMYSEQARGEAFERYTRLRFVTRVTELYAKITAAGSS